MKTDFDLNKLIGIPFKLNKIDLSGCDCRGIVYLYYKYIKNESLPSPVCKKISFRNINQIIQKMQDIASTFALPVSFKNLQEGDIVILKNFNSSGALGVCINDEQVLHMDKVVGSCLTKLYRLKEFFVMGYRPYV